MDTLCLVFKTFGDYALPLAGLFFSAIAFSPTWEAWFRREAKSAKQNVWKRRTLSACLGIFCILLIAASIRIQLVQSKQQDPVYQKRMMLEIDAKQISDQLYEYARNVPRSDDLFSRGTEFCLRFGKLIDQVRTDLRAQGLHSNELDELSEQLILERLSNIPTSEAVRQIEVMAKELSRLSDNLKK